MKSKMPILFAVLVLSVLILAISSYALFAQQNQDSKTNLSLDTSAVNKDTNSAISKDVDVKLPSKIPTNMKAKTKKEIESKNGEKIVEVVFEGDGQGFLFIQDKIDTSKENVINNIINNIFRNDNVEKLQIQGYPALYKNGRLYIITDTIAFLISSQNLDKEKMIEIANSIDLSNL